MKHVPDSYFEIPDDFDDYECECGRCNDCEDESDIAERYWEMRNER